MDSTSSADPICTLLALPFATPNLRKQLPRHWFQNIASLQHSDAACCHALRQLITTVASEPLDPAVDGDYINLWRGCPHTKIHMGTVHPRAPLCMQTLLNMSVGSGGFQTRTGQAFYGYHAEGKAQLQKLVSRDILIQLMFEFGHCGISSINGACHWEHIWFNRFFRTEAMSCRGIYEPFMRYNKEGFPEDSLEVLCPADLNSWVRDWITIVATPEARCNSAKR